MQQVARGEEDRQTTAFHDAELVVACLASPLYGYPYEAMRRAMELPQQVAPLLLRSLRVVATTSWEKVSRQQRSLTDYGMYLLASFREPAAFAPILAFYTAHFISLDIMQRFHMRRLLGSTYEEGSLPLLDPVIVDCRLPPLLRREAVLTLGVAYKAGKINRSILSAYLTHLLGRFTTLVDQEALAAVYELIRDLHVYELQGPLRANYQACPEQMRNSFACLIDELEAVLGGERRGVCEEQGGGQHGDYELVHDPLVETMSFFSLSTSYR